MLRTTAPRYQRGPCTVNLYTRCFCVETESIKSDQLFWGIPLDPALWLTQTTLYTTCASCRLCYNGITLNYSCTYSVARESQCVRYKE
jgi:hypothetical protein